MKREQGGSGSWQDFAQQLLQETIPVKSRKVHSEYQKLPKLVNFVSTVTYLPPNSVCKLPLLHIALNLGSCAQYSPRLFAAVIINFELSTILLFASGKAVIVSGLSIEHTRYVSQAFRTVLGCIQCVFHDKESNQTEIGTLNRTTVFINCRVHNIVSHANLDVGCKIDLQAMCDVAPGCCKWEPDFFPGLKCKIWLNEDYQCKCPSGFIAPVDRDNEIIKKVIGKARKCECSLKVLIFDSGKFVITGARRTVDVNAVFFRIQDLVPQFKSSNNAYIPRDDVFYKRLSTMMVPTGLTSKEIKTAVREKPVVDPTDAFASVVSNIHFAKKNSTPASLDRTPPFIRIALSGRVDDVLLLLQINKNHAYERDEQGRTALDRLRLIPSNEMTQEHKTIIDMLK
jgi:TATA-box binding protein (TBP) (component of TFIID and TFIIIB)